MKKEYKKPIIMVENFLLSECIASCGEAFGNNMDVDGFIEQVKGFTGYFTLDDGCTEIVVAGQDYTLLGQTLCYHTSSNVVFSS